MQPRVRIEFECALDHPSSHVASAGQASCAPLRGPIAGLYGAGEERTAPGEQPRPTTDLLRRGEGHGVPGGDCEGYADP